jgi:peptidoglycan/xylan/chitin deacetylase (PgdA/CDA1 family)
VREPIVLCYHAITPDWDSVMAVTPERFDQQLRRLLRLGYRPDTFTRALLTPAHERAFVVTFDDAFSSVREHALPILQRLGIPATLYVPTGWVGDAPRRATWGEMERWDNPHDGEHVELMTWDEVSDLADAGWEIGSHTHLHPRLTRVDDAVLEEELHRSRQIVQEHTGQLCESIAYPYGDVDDRVVAAAQRAGYRTGGALDRMRTIRPPRPSTPLRWRRLGVYLVDDSPRFEAKLGLLTYGSRGVGTAVPDPYVPGARAAPPAAEPRVAVIVPCYQDGPLAKEAVASVVEDEPVEIVVVDDASPDEETAQALDELRAAGGVRVVRQETNQGLSAARRAGLAATSARYVFPLDADDLLMPGALGRLADRLDEQPTAAATWGDVVEFGTRSRRGTPPLRLEGFRVAYRNDYPVCSMFRRTVLEEVGAWQDVGGMVGYEDWNLWMTLAERYAIGLHAGPGVIAVRRRLHGPRMLGDSIKRHRALYAELRRTHPRLFAEIRRHRRLSALSWSDRILYPLLYGARPPMGIRTTAWALAERLKRLKP